MSTLNNGPLWVWDKIMDLYKFYEWCLTRADPRVENWFMMRSICPTLSITALYLTIVYIGPKWMAKRRPFSLQWILIPYNLAMTLLNLYIGLELAVTSTKLGYNYFCQPVNYDWDPDEIRIAKALWWYYFSRLVEMSDTVFLILRKKTKQLSFLHVYHHSTMFCLWWIGIKWVPGGSSFLAAMVNSFIHVFMYLYYALSACGPRVAAYLWWKRYLTILQLAQFTSALVMGIRAIIVGCDFPLWMQYALIVYMLSFLALFGNFYYKAYCTKHASAKRHERRKDGEKNLTHSNSSDRQQSSWWKSLSGGDAQSRAKNGRKSSRLRKPVPISEANGAVDKQASFPKGFFSGACAFHLAEGPKQRPPFQAPQGDEGFFAYLLRGILLSVVKLFYVFSRILISALPQVRRKRGGSLQPHLRVFFCSVCQTNLPRTSISSPSLSSQMTRSCANCTSENSGNVSGCAARESLSGSQQRRCSNPLASTETCPVCQTPFSENGGICLVCQTSRNKSSLSERLTTPSISEKPPSVSITNPTIISVNPTSLSTVRVPVCTGHRIPCEEKQVRKEGPTRGRLFYACASRGPSRCNFFQWADLHFPKCKHNVLTCRRQVLKQNENNGREFYVCSKRQGEQCDFFQWAD